MNKIIWASDQNPGYVLQVDYTTQLYILGIILSHEIRIPITHPEILT